MRPGTPLFVSERLQEAREARALTVAGLAEILDVTRETVYQMEAGRITPGPALFARLQSSLRLPAAFFISPVGDPVTGTVLFRSLTSATKVARLRARRRLRWLQRLSGFVRGFVDLPMLDISPCLSVDDPLMIRSVDIERCADGLRTQWSLGKGPIANMAWLLENHGVIIAREDLAADTLDAVALQDSGDVFMILGAEKGAAVRSRLDAAHELAHLALHGGCPEPSGEKDPIHKVMERQAFLFAGAFLLPAESFGSDVMQATLDEFLALKPKWGVSVGAMIMRAKELDLVSESHERRLWMQYSRKGWRRGEPFDSEWTPEQPLLLRRSLELMLSERVVTVGQVLNETTIAASDIEDLAGMPRGAIDGRTAPIQFKGTQAVTGHSEGNISAFRRVVR